MENFDISRIDGHALRVFISICETESLSKTADVFGLNQSTVSHTLDKLRAAIGDPLFVRKGRGITPTERAMQIEPRVRALLVDLESLVAPETFDISKETREFVLAIPNPAVLADVKLAQAKLAKSAPNLPLHLARLAPREHVTEMLSSGLADLAICVSGFRYPPVLNSTQYGVEELAVFYDAAHRGPIETLEDYGQARHGVVNFGGTTKSVVALALEEANMSRRIAIVSPTASMLGHLIEGTDIVATMPKRLSQSGYSALAHAPPPIDLPHLSYDLVWHRKFEHSGRHIWFRKLMQDVAKQVYGIQSDSDPAASQE